MGNLHSGRGGVEPQKRAEISRLLRVGQLNHAEIARQTGVNVSTVYRQSVRLASGEEDDAAPVRCPGCGGLVLASESECRRCYGRKTYARPGAHLLRRRRSQKARFVA